MANFSIKINEETFSGLASYSLAFEDITDSTQTADGTNVVSHIATKAKITVGWQMLKNAELKAIAAKIENAGRNSIEYYDYTKDDNRSEGDFYVDNRSAAIAIFDENDEPVWEEYTLTFIEA